MPPKLPFQGRRPNGSIGWREAGPLGGDTQSTPLGLPTTESSRLQHPQRRCNVNVVGAHGSPCGGRPTKGNLRQPRSTPLNRAELSSNGCKLPNRKLVFVNDSSFHNELEILLWISQNSEIRERITIDH